MTYGTFKNCAKALAIAQAIAAPSLMVIGAITKSKNLTTIGAVWCGWIALDTSRTVCDAIDNVAIINDWDDDEEF